MICRCKNGKKPTTLESTHMSQIQNKKTDENVKKNHKIKIHSQKKIHLVTNHSEMRLWPQTLILFLYFIKLLINFLLYYVYKLEKNMYLYRIFFISIFE